MSNLRYLLVAALLSSGCVAPFAEQGFENIKALLDSGCPGKQRHCMDISHNPPTCVYCAGPCPLEKGKQ